MRRAASWSGRVPQAPRPPPASPQPAAQDRAPLAYTPPYLAEKILTSRSALEGERKQVTVLFADLKGSTELLPTSIPKRPGSSSIRSCERMMDAVHRYEGTVNQVLGDGIMALFGAPHCPRRPRRARLLRRPGHAGRHAALCRGGAPHPRPGRCRCAWASTPARWWCGPLATTCTWTTRPWARPRIWRRAWNSWPRRAASC